MPTRLPLLSKSRFWAGIQCPLRLWYQCYNRELATEASPSQQAIFDMGHEVGKLATRVYPGGILIGEDHLHHQQAVQSTRTGLDDLSVPAIPRYAYPRPSQSLPFQWSDHIFFEDGTLEHQKYLCNEDKDPREEFTTTLLEGLEKGGGIFIYGSYENEIITRLVEELPHHRRELLALLDRFRDLHAGIRKYFYHPEFLGSFSLKTVLPVLVPTMKYERPAIQEGNMASLEYLCMLDPSTSPKERERIKADLLAYCGHDTLGMVKIRKELLGRFGK